MRSPMTLRFTLACTFVACLPCLACGDSDPGAVDSGLPADKLGSELSASEADTLCQARVDNLAAHNSDAEREHASCVVQGIAFSATAKDPVASCELFVPMCLDAPPQNTGTGDGCPLTFLATCEASVADIEACLSEQNEATAAAIRDASCDAAGKDPVAPVAGPVCSKLKTSCPGIA